jgi:hypothetical protein
VKLCIDWTNPIKPASIDQPVHAGTSAELARCTDHDRRNDVGSSLPCGGREQETGKQSRDQEFHDRAFFLMFFSG